MPTRHLDMDLDVLRWSDKPYFPVGATYESLRDSVDLAAIAFGGREAIAERPVMLGIVNLISPLSFDERMAGSAIAYAEGGQPVVFMPFVFGGTARWAWRARSRRWRRRCWQACASCSSSGRATRS